MFIDATRDIAPGQELGYDYEIGREKDDPPNVDEIYACRCGSPKCRGTMLWPAKKPAAARKKKPARKKPREVSKNSKSKTAKRATRKDRRPKQVRRGERSRRRA